MNIASSGLGDVSFRLDLHNHTHFSADGVQSLAELLEKAAIQGIDCLAVTDHNTVRGGLEGVALAAKNLHLPRVIPGVELNTQAGEIVGLFVSEELPSMLPVEEAVARIHAQGGLVYLPHPYDKLRRGAVNSQDRMRVAVLADIIETLNGRSLGRRAGKKSAELAASVGKPAGAGSDAHMRSEVGAVWIRVAEMPTRENLLRLLATGQIEHNLRGSSYALNWGRMGSAPLIRLWRRIRG